MRIFGPSSPGGGGIGQKLKVDIVGRWGRVAPMKRKLSDLKKDGGECPESVLPSPVQIGGPNEEESCSISRKIGASVLNRYCLLQ